MAEETQPAEARRAGSPGWWRVRPSFLSVAALAVAVALVAWLSSRWSGGPPLRGRNRIVLAVIPFENASGEAEQDYWSDGLTDEVIAQLGSAAPGQLTVIGPATAAHYKRSRKGIADIGRELGADFILKGSLRRSGNRMRVAVDLLAVGEPGPLWSAAFEREDREVQQLESELGRAVARRIRLEYGSGAWPAEPRPTRSPGHVQPEAYSLYLKGRALAKPRTPDGLRRGLALFGQAVALDPQLAAVHRGLAETQLVLALDELLPPREILDKARKEIETALHLDDASAEAHGVNAMVRLYANGDFSGAEREFRLALTLNPGETVARYRFGYHCLRGQDRGDDALTEVRRALATDPLAIPAKLALADLLIDANQAQEAVELCRSVLAIDATNPAVYLVQGAAFEDLGAFEEATAAFETADRLSPDHPGALLEVARLQALTGRGQEARKTLARALPSDYRYAPPIRLARLLLALGENERALQVLERAYAERAVALPLLARDSRFEALRASPRFRKLLKPPPPA
ncbi:MAG TPA: tetratricopeptide repeat protein [Vicinamibacteria bacterium]|nr:tetratricopeptide repeat protein [Vicinamibacteria bacterium]